MSRNRDLPTAALQRAGFLAEAVHELGEHEIRCILGSLTRQQLYDLTVTLAAMVPVDYSHSELLAWNDVRYMPDAPTLVMRREADAVSLAARRRLKPHGTHAAFNRHRNHGEEPCDPCWHGERVYQRDRDRDRGQVSA